MRPLPGTALQPRVPPWAAQLGLLPRPLLPRRLGARGGPSPLRLPPLLPGALPPLVLAARGMRPLLALLACSWAHLPLPAARAKARKWCCLVAPSASTEHGSPASLPFETPFLLPSLVAGLLPHFLFPSFVRCPARPCCLLRCFLPPVVSTCIDAPSAPPISCLGPTCQFLLCKSHAVPGSVVMPTAMCMCLAGRRERREP